MRALLGLLVFFVGAADAFGVGGADLVALVKAGDAAAFKTALDAGADANQTAPDGSTALHWAAHQGDSAAVRLLLEAGADATVANRYGVTPLLPAATVADAAVVRLLLDAGADPNAALPEGETALMRAARTGVAESVRLLLDAGADPNARESWRRQTALMWAAAEGHADVAKLLIDAGAEVESRSSGGFTPLLFAARHGRPAVCQTLLAAGADINQTLEEVTEPGWGNQPTSRRDGGPTPLDIAVANAHFELAAMLLDAGADPNIAAQGWTPLHTITWIRKPGQGSNDPAPEGSGSMDSLRLVRKLVEHGADVNARMTTRRPVGRSSLNSEGATPFLQAARTADTELMKLLVELGADPLLPNVDGTTPLMVAAGVGTRAPTEDAGRPDEVVEAVRLALELGGDPNQRDRHGETVMHGVAYKHAPAAVAVLAEAGADPAVWDRKNRSGWTPLRIAVGVHRGMNLRSSPETAEEIAELLRAAGRSTEVDPEPVISGATQ